MIYLQTLFFSKQNTDPYLKFLASQSVLDNLIKENSGYFFNELQTKVFNILLGVHEWSAEKENELKRAVDKFLKPLNYVSEEKTNEIFEIYFKFYKNSAMYIPDNKETIDEYYKNSLVDLLNTRLQKQHIDKNNFSFNNFESALQYYKSLKEKEVIIDSIPSNLNNFSNMPQKRI